MNIRPFAFLLAFAAAAPVAAQPSAPPIVSEEVTIAYVKAADGSFSRSGVMRFPDVPRGGDEIRAGPSEYRVLRTLFVMAGEGVGETRIYVERLGAAAKD